MKKRRILPLLLVLVMLLTGCADMGEDLSSIFSMQALKSWKNGLDIHSDYGGDNLPQESYLPVTAVYQNPELPTGCESTSLTMALNTLGFAVDKTTIVDSYLVYATEDYKVGFSGSPYSSEGAGIWPPGLVKTAQNYLKEQETSLWAHDLSDKTLEELYPYVAAGYPVLLWITSDYGSPYFEDYHYEYKGETYHWYGNEHCVVLSGYSMTNNTVTLVDPLQGELQMDASQISSIYEEVGELAIGIY